MTMREILFRGKHMSGSLWCYGNLAVRKDGVAIITPDDTPCGVYGQVAPDTVGQYTGLTDKNGRKIFEGDIVECFDSVGQIVFTAGCFGVYIISSIDWNEVEREMCYYPGPQQLNACFNDNVVSLWEIIWNFDCDDDCCDKIVVVGNIHDNPELLEGGAS